MFVNKPKSKDLLKKKGVQEGKEANLGRGGFLVLIMAISSVLIPVTLLFYAILGILIWLFLLYIH